MLMQSKYILDYISIEMYTSVDKIIITGSD